MSKLQELIAAFENMTVEPGDFPPMARDDLEYSVGRQYVRRILQAEIDIIVDEL